MDLLARRIKTSDNLEELLEVFGFVVLRHIPLNLLTDGFRRFLEVFRLNKENELLLLLFVGNRVLQHFDQVDAHFERQPIFAEILDFDADFKQSRDTDEKTVFSGAEVLKIVTIKFVLEVADRLREFFRNSRKFSLDQKLANLIFAQFGFLFRDFENEFMGLPEEVSYFLKELAPHVSEELLAGGHFLALGLDLFQWKMRGSLSSDNDFKKGEFGVGGSRCLNLITDSLSLHEVLLELGPAVMANSEHLEKLIRQFNNIDTLDVLTSILFFIKQNLDPEGSGRPRGERTSDHVDKLSTDLLLFDRPRAPTEWDAERDAGARVGKWDLENLAKTLNKIFFSKISWVKIIQSMDTDDPLVLSLIGDFAVFKKFWGFVRKLGEWFNLVPPSRLFNRPWKFYETQKIFLISCFQLLDEGNILVLPEEIDPANLNGSERSSKNLVHDLNKAFGFKGLTPAFAQSIRELGPLWCDPAVLTLLVEMSEDHRHSNRISSLLEKSLKNNSQGILIVLFNCKPREGLRLFQEILESSMKLILNSASNFSELIEAFFHTDKDLLALTLSQICERENSFLFLSKILDFSQNIKESLLSLIKSSNHFFSIRLALMAVKREFLRLEYWVNDRLSTCGLDWVESFLRYLHWFLIVPLYEKEADFEPRTQSKASIEDVLEKSQLTMNAIAIIFENFLLNKQHESHIGSRYIDSIQKMYKRIQELIPKLAQVSINDTDKKANKLLESLYYKNMSIDEFISHLQNLKVSRSNRDQEILSCIIINIIDEFRFYKNFPKKELLLTAQVFGRVIKNKIIDGKTSSIIVKAVMDSLKKDDNMFEFGHLALQIFIDDVELTSGLVNSIVNNKRLFEKDFALLDGLVLRLEKEKKLNLIKPDKLDKIKARRNELLSKKKFPLLPEATAGGSKALFPKQSQPEKRATQPVKSLQTKILKKKESLHAQTKSSLRKSSLEYKIDLKSKPGQDKRTKIAEPSLELQKEYSKFKSVKKFMEAQFYKLESKLNVVRVEKDQIIMWFNKLITPVENSLPEFNQLVKTETVEEWFATYLVYRKAIGDVTYHKMYNTFLSKANRKRLTHRIYMMTMEAVDQIMRFGRYVDIQTSEDNQFLRNVAKWLGLMTICRNKPILKFKLDIRQRVLEAVKTPTVNSFVTILTILIAMGCESLLFKPHNPYMQSLLDLCRELNMIAPVTTASKNYILMAFKRVQMKDKDCHRFGFIDKHSDAMSLRVQKSNMLPMYIDIDKSLLMPIQDQQLNDIKKMVNKAIVNSVKTVTKPVLERSVKNAILTTRILCKKDLANEPDAKKFEKAAEAMVTNLAGNLALVTCKEPLRSQITQKLNALLWEYTNENRRVYEKIRKSIPEKNLNLACEMVYRRVIYNAKEQIHNDEIIRKCIEERRQAKSAGKVYYDAEEHSQIAVLPEQVKASLQHSGSFLGEIYTQSSSKIGISNYIEVSQRDGLLISNVRGGNDYFESSDSNEETLNRIFHTLEKEIAGPVDKEKFERINRLFFKMQRALKDFRGDINRATKNMTIKIFKKVVQLGLEMEKCKALFDLVGLLHKFNKNISSILAEILASIQEKKKNKLNLVGYLFRKNLINLKKFDKAFASRLRDDGPTHVNVTVQILKRLVIEEKIFDIQAFPEITEELIKLDPSQSANKALKSGSRIFIKNMSDYLREQTASNRTKFSLSNLETEYSKLRIDLDEYFTHQKEHEMGLMDAKYTRWLDCDTPKKRESFVTDFVENFMRPEYKNNLILIFSYLFERIISRTLQDGPDRPCFRLVDSFSLMVVEILERLKGSTSKIQFLERVLSSLIMVITRRHFFFEEGRHFNQKPFFRILFNLVLQINQRSTFTEKECTNVSIIMIHTLRILQPVKYPGFSFTWLALVSNKFIMRSLLRPKKNEHWQNYTMLLNGLMLFFKEAQTKSQNFHMTPQVNKFYKATLFFLLVLVHDFPEYVSDQSEFILEEVPDSFKQVRNIILSAAPSNIKMPPPRKAVANLRKIEEECPRLPNLPYKIENRICSMNLNVRLANFFQRMDAKEIENIRDLLYLFDYSGKSTVNKKLVKSFTLYTAHFVYSKCLVGSNRNMKKMYSLRKETFKLFLSLLMKEEESLRIVLINSFADNLRYCDFYTVYFIQLLGFIVTDSENLVLEELVFKTLFERFLVGDLHPWGLATAIYYVFHVSKKTIHQKKYYKENKEIFNIVYALITPNHKSKNS